ncbi:hypothetical protein B7453_01830 [Pseudomonas sp. IB20]|uniref:XRE family transcriptional regulator n=1 Tax=Pseudomonas TaxID=286 RepID=UPI000BA1116C|nr:MULTISPECIES: XRE family transcriptional regulator [unclassified Pseudomonas]OZO06120.1 hypothetical protein B7453_01830 [Pseudomonas sp. IB20]
MTDSKIYTERFSCVWDTPEQAANMRLRSKLRVELCNTIRRWEFSQEDAAQRLGISPPDAYLELS